MYRCPTAVLITRDTAKSAFHYNLYTLSPAITWAVHCQLSNIPLHCTQLLATCPACPSVVFVNLPPRGSRPICPPPVLVQFVHLLPFIVVTVPGVHHLLSLIQCSFHVFETTFPIPLTFFSLPPSLSCPSQRCSLPPPFLPYPCSFLILISLFFVSL